MFTDLDTALQEYPDLVKKHFMNSVSFDENKFLALHTALWSGGLFLYVPKNVEVEFPVQAIYLAAESGLLPHIIIVAEAFSSVTYVDHYFSEKNAEPTVHNGVVEVYVGEGAKVRFSTIHNFSSEIYDYTHRHADIARNGRIEWVIGEMNEGNTVSNNISILKGEASEADSKSIFVGTGNQRTNFVSKVIHEGEHTNSQILSRGVMLDRSTGIFNGITHMKKGCVKSNAQQTEKVLMLSEGSRGDANPILLIDENDVMAGHAASAGPVDQEDIYYLMSRGIMKEDAEKLIIHGFLAPVVSLIPIEGMQEKLENVIERKLGK
ncbi:Fe-S cluster assembly protein SufD [Tepidibacillus marianensis]|uniref:Fe-S cluster assembly protein SufD n=1 Tax=Tepidibacillus marianensis TaxID=3131995 RepID=UPI0030CD10EF